MTIEIEDAALARFLDGPAPHGSGKPTGFTTAREELALALEGQAPALSKLVFDRLGPAHTAELAQVVRRAVAVGIRRRAAGEVQERLEGAYDLLVAGLNQISECTTSEDEPERTCRVCGCTEENACLFGCYWVAADLCSQCGDGPGPEADRG